MERHKTTQSHANGTTMGRFPRLTPVRLSPQVPDHMTVSGEQSTALTKAQELCIKQFRIHQALWERRSKKHSDLAMAKHYRFTSASMALYLFIMHPRLYQNATSALRAAGKQYPNPLTSTHGRTATNPKFTTILHQQTHKPRICVEPNA